MVPELQTSDVISCLFKLHFFMNFKSHLEQDKGLSPVCVIMCVFSCEFCLKVFSHNEQECGLSPVCNRMCSVSFPFCVKVLSHSEHLKRFPPDFLDLHSILITWVPFLRVGDVILLTASLGIT